MFALPWPTPLSLIGAGLATWLAGRIGGGLAWVTVLAPAMAGHSASVRIALIAALTLPTGTLVLAAGALPWWRAIAHRGAARLDDRGMVRAALQATAAAFAIAAMLVAMIAIAGWPAERATRAEMVAGWLSMPVMVA